MTRDSYKKAFRDLKADILRVLKEREEHEQKLRFADAELRRLSESARAIGTLSGADPEEIEAWTNFDPNSQPGLTDAVLWALFYWKDRNPVTAKEIRDTITTRKIGELDKYKNALASIYTVLGRLIDSTDVDELTRGDDKRAFAITKKGIERITSRLSPALFVEEDYRRMNEDESGLPERWRSRYKR